MNKFLIGVVIVVAGGLAGWYFLKGNPSTNTPTSTTTTTVTETVTNQEQSTPSSAVGVTTQGSATITYTDSGFTPATITVKKGTAVTFENKSSTNMWVASDLHPTHKLLPGFDELKGGATGTKYTYTFDKVGTWTFHDHLHATNTGTVIVTE